MVNTGGVSSMFDFWSLWRKFDKECRVILDYPKELNNDDSVMKIIKQFCDQLSIDSNLPFEDKIDKLKQEKIFIASYKDVLIFKEKVIDIKDIKGAFPNIDLSEHIQAFNNALEMPPLGRKQIRKEEKEWLKSLVQEVVGAVIDSDNKREALTQFVELLKTQHPNLEIELSKAEGEIMNIRFKVSRDRILYINISEKTLGSSFGII